MPITAAATVTQGNQDVFVASTAAPASGTATPAALVLTAQAAIANLQRTNPRLPKLLSDLPGVKLWLDRQVAAGAVSTGAKPGEATSSVRWDVWTHGEGTKAKYGHNLTDKQVLNEDVIVVFKIDPQGKPLDIGGYRSYSGSILAVHRMCDLGRPCVAGDGGWLSNMNVEVSGQPGTQADCAWAIISIDQNGRVRGGGYPPPRPANHANGSGAGSAGGEYAGRRWLVKCGAPAYVPIIADEH